MHRIGGLAVIVGVMGWGQVSHATPILYSDLATYSLSNTRHSDIQIDFEGLAAPGGFINYGNYGADTKWCCFHGWPKRQPVCQRPRHVPSSIRKPL